MCDTLRPQDKRQYQLYLEDKVVKWESKLISRVGFRFRQSYEEVFLSLNVCSDVKRFFSKFDDVLNKKNIVPNKARNIMETSFAAVAASLYNDISTAQQAFSYSVAEALGQCLGACVKKRLRHEASSIKARTLSRISPKILYRIINGVR